MWLLFAAIPSKWLFNPTLSVKHFSSSVIHCAYMSLNRIHNSSASACHIAALENVGAVHCLDTLHREGYLLTTCQRESVNEE